MKADLPAIARVLREIAAGLILQGENRFRAAAYAKGAEALEAHPGDLDARIAGDRLDEIPGIGKALAAQIAEIRATGSSALHAQLATDLPPGAFDLTRNVELSLKLVRTLSDAGIRTSADLLDRARAGTLRTVPGITARTEARILKELDAPAEEAGYLLPDAIELAEALSLHLRGAPGVREVVTVGEVRRALEVVTVVEVLAASADLASPLHAAAQFSRVAAVTNETSERLDARLHDGMKIRVHACGYSSLPAATQRLTGNAAHNAELDALAEAKGYAITETGLYRRGERGLAVEVSVSSEASLYEALGLHPLSPLLRVGGGEVRAFAHPTAPARLIDASDIRGMVHCHTVYSDGRHSIEEMARAAEALGMDYLTITDHSPTANYANGVELDRLHRQWDEIARVQETTKIRILRGTESDILKDGSLDYPDHVLAELDVIVASIHNRYHLGPAEMTARVIKALRHPLYKIWGHALGRLLQKRAPIDVDIEAILEAAAESKVAIEINGDPHRLDLEPSLAQRAKALGIPFVVSVDAHSTAQFASLRFGLLMAGRAGLTPRDVLNTQPVERFLRSVKPRP